MISSPKSLTTDISKKIQDLATIAQVDAKLMKQLENEDNLKKYCEENPDFVEVMTRISVEEAKANVKELAEKYQTMLKWYLETKQGQFIPSSKYQRFDIFGLSLYDLQLVLGSNEKKEFFWQTGLTLPESKDSAKVVAAKAIAVKSAQAKILQFAKMANVNPTHLATLANENDLGKYADDYPRHFIMIKETDIESAQKVVQELSSLHKTILKWKLESAIKVTLYPTNKFSEFHLFSLSSYELKSILSMLENSEMFRSANPEVDKTPSHTVAYDNAKRKRIEPSVVEEPGPKLDSESDEKQVEKKEEKKEEPMRKSSTRRSPKK